MNLPEPVTYRIDEESHYALWELMSRKSGLKGLQWSLAILALGGLLFGLVLQSIFAGLAVIGIGMFAVLVAMGVTHASLRMRARKVYRESASLHEEMTLTFHDDGFEIDQASGRHRIRWPKMVRWYESAAIMAVFPNRYLAFIFPKDQVSEVSVNHIREQLMQSGLPLPWKLRK